jgi:succinylarginine dihydrolase
MNKAWEVNFDSLVGPTHHYAGLAPGNLASMRNRGRKSNPRHAALQGLEKMRLLMQLGVPQAVLPPHQRPYLPLLRRLGFSGSDRRMLQVAARNAPLMLAACSSAAAMWAANAATVSPSADTADHRVHITPANLISQLHRSIEATFTTRVLRKIFDNPRYFVVHDPLPTAIALRDEGAANHMRLAPEYGAKGLEIFTFDSPEPYFPDLQQRHFPARQTLGAAVAVQYRHLLDSEAALSLQRLAIGADTGAFHNDLTAMSNQSLLIYHQKAYAADTAGVISRMYRRISGCKLQVIGIRENRLSLAEAVRTYLFNSQLVTIPDGSMVLLAPEECRRSRRAAAIIEELIAQGAFREVHYVQVRQSMRNGGGPACLRLRIVLNRRESAAMHQGVLLTERLYTRLKAWVNKHYRDHLHPADLADPKLLRESLGALDELSRILKLGDIYDFQM